MCGPVCTTQSCTGCSVEWWQGQQVSSKTPRHSALVKESLSGTRLGKQNNQQTIMCSFVYSIIFILILEAILVSYWCFMMRVQFK